MVMMENFHHIHCFLCQKKIPCLEDKKREAKQRYSEHMEKYVTKYLGQPLEKLNVSTGEADPCLGLQEQLPFPKSQINWCSNQCSPNPV